MSGEFESTEVREASSRKTPVASSLLAARSSVGFAAAPSLPTMMRADSGPVDPTAWPPGHQIDDFQVIAMLGKGGFGAVYLAWQLSLGRQVALKVSPCIGQEGRTLARLDHPHIVRVYSESVREQTRLLCMQYVASIPLDKLIAKLADGARGVARPDADAPRPSKTQGVPPAAGDWTGAELLSLIDASHSIAAEFDPAQLADRQFLSELDHVDAVCWIGSRLADALAHAHRHGVLHRDLKPGNVLVSQYGRPLLVDFNLANLTEQDDGTASQVFGGTLPYMSPEHLQAFDPLDPGDQKLVTEQSDIYSLGVVLFELLTGRMPFPSHNNEPMVSQRVSLMIADRRQPETIWENFPAAEPAVRSVLARALEPDPARRWTTADEFSQALSDVLDLRATLRKVSRTSRFASRFAVRPFVFLTILGLVPHFVGSLVNIPYNLLRVAGEKRLAVFFELVNVYNVVVYPACVGLCVWMVWPVFQWWRTSPLSPGGRGAGGEGDVLDGERVQGPKRVRDLPLIRPTATFSLQGRRTETSAKPSIIDEPRRAWLRKRVLNLPYLAIYIALLGWLPGAVWFPWGLHYFGLRNGVGPVTWSEMFHLQVSVAVSGLIALTYSALGVAYLSVCVFYPRLWTNPLHFHEQARRDVAGLRWLLWMIPFLALAIPLVGAILSITTTDETFNATELRTFKYITTGLIVLGMIGFQLAVVVTGRTRRAVDAFAGADEKSAPR